jgi:LysM repeat protein
MKTRVDRSSICVLLILTSIFWLDIGDELKSFTYEVKRGDSLYEIAHNFGNQNWWVDIYQENYGKIANPDLIYPGQILVIPSFIVQNIQRSIDHKSLENVLAMSREFSVQQDLLTEKEKLKKFRTAFKKLVKADRDVERPTEKQTLDYSGLEFGVMVLDETRSKMGGNFYSAFYKHWETPEGARNSTITISEQPMPSMGTLVQVEIDNQIVFRNRLQPKYYQNEQAAKRAVQICRYRLQRMAATQDEYAGY